jgi:hypothetical protein
MFNCFRAVAANYLTVCVPTFVYVDANSPSSHLPSHPAGKRSPACYSLATFSPAPLHSSSSIPPGRDAVATGLSYCQVHEHLTERGKELVVCVLRLSSCLSVQPFCPASASSHAASSCLCSLAICISMPFSLVFAVYQVSILVLVKVKLLPS